MTKTKTKQAECKDHGPYESRNASLWGECWTGCPQCEEDRDRRIRAESEAMELERRKTLWVARLDEAGIPERFRESWLEAYKADLPGQKKALAWANDYAEGFGHPERRGRSALLMGKPGTGKTHLAVAIALHVLKQGGSVRYTTVQRMFRAIKATWTKGSAITETKAVAEFTKPDLLILDEVGVQFGSDDESSLIFDVLNERYEERRATLLLSNFAQDLVVKFLGERVIDRFREDGGRVMVFDWDSHRRGQ